MPDICSKHNSNNMERRRIQNREAQRRYRENIKRKLQLAEIQLQNRRSSDSVLRNLDVSCGHGDQDEQDTADDSCQVDDRLAALESSSPGLDFDWTSLDSSCHVQNAIGLLSPSESISDKAPTLSSTGSTVMHIAAQKGYHTIVRILSGSGVDVSSRDDSGQTPLHLAAALGHSDTIVALLDAGAEIEAKNLQGHTPLSVAVSRGDDASVKILLESGADPNARISFPAPQVDRSIIDTGTLGTLPLSMKDPKTD